MENETNLGMQSNGTVPSQPGMPAMQSDQPAAPTASQIKYAGFWVRWIAVIIDGFVLMIPNLIIGVIFNALSLPKLATAGSYIILWLYYILMTKKYQATLGKKALGIRVVSDKSENLSWGQLILRETIGKLISMFILFIGYIMAGFTERKQALHDKLASTVVVHNDPNQKIPVWAIVVALFLPMVAIIGTLASIVLVSLSSAKNKAQDAGNKAVLSSAQGAAILYLDEKNTLKGFGSDIKLLAGCNDAPIINIAPSGKDMAIFAKSCVNSGKYFCIGIQGDVSEVEEDYAKSGAAACSTENTSAGTTQGALEDSSENSSTDLANTFKDDFLGYQINYPKGWVQSKEEDKESGVITVTFLPDKANPSVTVYTQSVLSEQVVTPDILNSFMKSMKGELVKAQGKVYDEKDFVYKFADGTSSAGKTFIAEYIDGGINVKHLLVVIPNGKKLYWLTIVSDVNQYEVNSSIGLAMLDSWKITK